MSFLFKKKEGESLLFPDEGASLIGIERHPIGMENKAWETVHKLESIEKELLKQYDKPVEKTWVNSPWLDPQCTFILIWWSLNILLTYEYFFQIPISFAFEYHRNESGTDTIFRILNVPAIVVFILNVGIKLKTSFYKGGILVEEQYKIFVKYVKGGLIIDFLSISVLVLNESIQENNASRPNSDLRFSLLLFYLRIGELLQMQDSIISVYDLNRRVKAALRLSLLMLKLIMICNTVACGFFFLSDHVCPTVDCYDCCWVFQVSEGGVPIKFNSWGVQYIYSLYWASTTMITIGYGDIVPKNIYEVFYTLFVQYFSCFMFAYAVNRIWEILAELNAKEEKIYRCLNNINVYMRDKQITASLRSKINAYLSNYYRVKNIRDAQLDDQVTKRLSPSLKADLLFGAYGHMFRNQVLFCLFSDDFLKLLSQHVEEVFIDEQETLCSPVEAGISYSLMYLDKGSLSCVKQSIVCGALQTGHFISFQQFFTQTHYKATVTTSSCCSIYRLTYGKFIDQLRASSNTNWEQYWNSRHRWMYYLEPVQSIKTYESGCYFCTQPNHFFDYKTIKQIRNCFISVQTHRSTPSFRLKPFRRRVSKKQWGQYVPFNESKFKRSKPREIGPDALSVMSDIKYIEQQEQVTEAFHYDKYMPLYDYNVTNGN